MIMTRHQRPANGEQVGRLVQEQGSSGVAGVHLFLVFFLSLTGRPVI